MNVKYANKVVLNGNYSIPAGEFNHQVEPIHLKAGKILWKYCGKYNKQCPDLVKGGLKWGSSWCGEGHVIPMEYLEFVSELV